MTHPNGRVTISFNGEITNYVEIREELKALGEEFSSGTDTEVLLKGWARWGHATLDRLEGMFAFAVLDEVAKTLTLVRDPFGIKPLFIYRTPERVAFNSELRGLIAGAIDRPRLDWQAALDYLQWSVYDQTDRTFVEGVRQLEPGHVEVLDTMTGATLSTSRYWNPSVEQSYRGTYGSAVATVREMFIDSVRRNLRSDVPVGVALSGGIDSSAIVAAVRHLEPSATINTFSYIAPGFRESEHEWVHKVAEALRCESHTVMSTGDDLARDLDDLILTQGEPFGSTSIYAQYRVFQLAREKGIVVALDGQGGDEVFAGYDGYPVMRMKSLIETNHVFKAWRFARNWAEWPGRSVAPLVVGTAGQFLPQRLRGRVIRPTLSPILDEAILRERGVELRFPLAPSGSERGRRLVSQLRTAQTRVGLPGLLRHSDHNSMRFSIESRVPFLDRRLAQFVMSLPEDWIVGPDGTTKRVLRDAIRGLLPDEVVDRRDKVGFSTPQDAWLDRLARADTRESAPVPFLRDGRDASVTGGYLDAELGWGPDSRWRLINLRRWLTLMGVDAS